MQSLMLLVVLSGDVTVKIPAELSRDTIHEFKVEGVDAKSFILWDISPWERASIKEIDGNTVFFAAPPGEYAAVVRVLDPDTRKQQVFRSKFSVVEKSPGPQPPTPGPPGPGPVPPGPGPSPSKYGLVEFTVSQAKALSPAALARKGHVANALRGIASGIGDGSITIPSLPSTIRKKLDEAYGQETSAWKPFDGAVQTELRRLVTVGQVRDAATFAEALTEVAVGLESVK